MRARAAPLPTARPLRTQAAETGCDGNPRHATNLISVFRNLTSTLESTTTTHRDRWGTGRIGWARRASGWSSRSRKAGGGRPDVIELKAQAAMINDDPLMQPQVNTR